MSDLEKQEPDKRAGDMVAMAPFWRQVSTILGGTAAMRDAGTAYLPQFPDESLARYETRRKAAKFTNVFRDIVENLAQRPFSSPVTIADGTAGDQIASFVDNVDGAGNNLHVFAGEAFFQAISYGVDWILVDYTRDVPPGATVAEEVALGARPYWVRYGAQSVLAAYSDIIDGQEQFVHVRLREPSVTRDGFEEKSVERIRVLERPKIRPGKYGPAQFQLWEEVDRDNGREWAVVDEGQISIGVIPIVPVLTGRRVGSSWRIHPPMQDAADLQIELYQQESALKHAKTMTAFPMLAGNGVTPPMGDNGKPAPTPVGPHAVLFAPEGSWQFIEPGATALKFLADDIKETILQLRELGRQPLTAQSGNLTVITTAFAAEKGNSAIQAWALNLKDALERALDFTAKWLKVDDDPTVQIDTDFELAGAADTYQHVLALRSTGEISREAAIHEAKRRQILDAEYDGMEDLEAILGEIEGADGETGPLDMAGGGIAPAAPGGNAQ